MNRFNSRIIGLVARLLALLEDDMALDFTALNAAIGQLSADADTLITEKQSGDQQAQTVVDAATTAVTAIDTKVKAAS